MSISTPPPPRRIALQQQPSMHNDHSSKINPLRRLATAAFVLTLASCLVQLTLALPAKTVLVGGGDSNDRNGVLHSAYSFDPFNQQQEQQQQPASSSLSISSSLSPLAQQALLSRQQQVKKRAVPSFMPPYCTVDSDCSQLSRDSDWPADVKLVTGDYACVIPPMDPPTNSSAAVPAIARAGSCQFVVAAGEHCNVDSDCASYAFYTRYNLSVPADLCSVSNCNLESTCGSPWEFDTAPPSNLTDKRPKNNDPFKCCGGLPINTYCGLMASDVDPCEYHSNCKFDGDSLRDVANGPLGLGSGLLANLSTDAKKEAKLGVCIPIDQRQHVWIGVVITLISSTILNIGLNGQKYALRKHDEQRVLKELELEEEHERWRTELGWTEEQVLAKMDQEEEEKQLKKPKWYRVLEPYMFWREIFVSKLWAIGLFVFIVGNLGGFVALRFAPQSLTAPLGSISLISNVIIAPLINKEVLGKWDIAGIFFIVAGSVIVVVFSGIVAPDYKLCVLIGLFHQTDTIVYLAFIGACVVAAFVFIKFVEKNVENESDMAIGVSSEQQLQKEGRLFRVNSNMSAISLALKDGDHQDGLSINGNGGASHSRTGGASSASGIRASFHEGFSRIMSRSQSSQTSLALSSPQSRRQSSQQMSSLPNAIPLSRKSIDLDGRPTSLMQRQSTTPLPTTTTMTTTSSSSSPVDRNQDIIGVAGVPSEMDPPSRTTPLPAPQRFSVEGKPSMEISNQPTSTTPSAFKRISKDGSGGGMKRLAFDEMNLSSTNLATQAHAANIAANSNSPAALSRRSFQQQFRQDSSDSSSLANDRRPSGEELSRPSIHPRTVSTSHSIASSRKRRLRSKLQKSHGSTVGNTEEGFGGAGQEQQGSNNPVSLSLWARWQQYEMIPRLPDHRLIRRDSPLLRYWLPLAYAAMGGLMASITVLFAKSLINLLIISVFDGDNQFTTFLSWAILVIAVTTAVAQVYWINMGLKKYDALLQVPVFFTIWVLLDIIGGGIYYGEFDGFTTTKYVLFCLGVLVVFIGVGMLAKRLAVLAKDDVGQGPSPSSLAAGNQVGTANTVESQQNSNNSNPSTSASANREQQQTKDEEEAGTGAAGIGLGLGLLSEKERVVPVKANHGLGQETLASRVNEISDVSTNGHNHFHEESVDSSLAPSSSASSTRGGGGVDSTVVGGDTEVGGLELSPARSSGYHHVDSSKSNSSDSHGDEEEEKERGVDS